MNQFNVYSKEPLMRAIASTGLTPVGLGISFFLLVSLTLSLWGGFFEAPETSGNCVSQVGPCSIEEWRCIKYVSYFANISWSISILFLFPFVVALGYKYCREIPRLFQYLFQEIAQCGIGDKRVEDFYRWLDRRFNSYWVSGAILFITVALNAVYFHQILQEQKFTDWMTSGEILASMAAMCRGLTPVGVYAAIIQIVIMYWVFNLFWRGVVLAWGLNEFFNNREFAVKLEPLHPDGCAGLIRINNIATLLNMTLFLLGIYLSLKVVDKIIIQDSSLWADIGNPFMLAGYVILAPLLFFSPLAAAHQRLIEAKENFLRPLSKQCEQLFHELSDAKSDDGSYAAARALQELANVRDSFRKEIPVWPFDFKSLQGFAAAIVVPVLPIVMSLATQFLFGGSD